MASTVKVTRSHTLPVSQVKTRLASVEEKLKENKVEVKWVNDTTADISGQGINGNIDITGSEVTVNLTLAWYLSAMRNKIQQGVEDELKKALS